MSAALVVWAAGNSRIWWACPTCKVEAGVTLPVSFSEMSRRMEQFGKDHSECATKAQESKAWRG